MPPALCKDTLRPASTVRIHRRENWRHGMLPPLSSIATVLTSICQKLITTQTRAPTTDMVFGEFRLLNHSHNASIGSRLATVLRTITITSRFTGPLLSRRSWETPTGLLEKALSFEHFGVAYLFCLFSESLYPIAFSFTAIIASTPQLPTARAKKETAFEYGSSMRSLTCVKHYITRTVWNALKKTFRFWCRSEWKHGLISEAGWRRYPQ